MQGFLTRFECLYGAGNAERCALRLEGLLRRYGRWDTRPVSGPGWSERDAVLITYGDMVQSRGRVPLEVLGSFLDERLGDALNMVHVLPFFPWSSDDGFSVIDYRTVDEQLGTWNEISALAQTRGLMVDLVLNHCSSRSRWFRQFRNGEEPGRDYFFRGDPAWDLSKVVRPRESPVLTAVETVGDLSHVWTTFSEDQVDLDFRNPDVLFEFLELLLIYLDKGARLFRLDAIAFLWKRPGTSCVHLPETHEVVKLFRDVLDRAAPDALLITETNVPHRENTAYFGEGDEAHMVYQFPLPPLVLHALLTGDATWLTRWAAALDAPRPGCTFLNFTASHDGIGVRPLEGLVPQEETTRLVEEIRARGGRISERTGPDGRPAPYELNITWFDGLADPDPELHLARFLSSQAIALALQGIPAVYFHNLTATENQDLKEGAPARTINRRKWRLEELDRLLDDPCSDAARVFMAYRRLLELRRSQPAFHPDVPQEIHQAGPSLFTVIRRPPGRGSLLVAVTNVTPEAVPFDLHAAAPGDAEFWTDLIQEERVQSGPVTLGPYRTAWWVRA